MTDSPEKSALNPEVIRAQFSMAIREAMNVVQPGSVQEGLSPLDVFPESSDRRSDTPFEKNFTPEQERQFRKAMAEMGVGVSENKTASQVGLPNDYIAIIEAGQPHKMIAELNVAERDQKSKPSVYFVTGTPGREIKDAERELSASLLGIDEAEVADDEYHLAQQVIAARWGFVPNDGPADLPYTYNHFYEEGPSKVGVSLSSTNQQFVMLGTLNGASVISLRIDREYPDESDPKRYVQPGPEAVMKIVDLAVTGINGDLESPIGFITSNTYKPSRTLAALGASKGFDQRPCAVVSYGTKELAEVKGGPEAPPAINQLAGEAYEAAKVAEM